MNRFVALSLTLAIAGVAAATARADSFRVVHDRFLDERTFVDGTTCPFPIVVQTSASIDDRFYFDADGNLVRVLETVDQVVFSYTAHGTTLEAKGSGGFDVHFNPDGSRTVATFGINLRLTLPGQGVIFLDTGHAVFLFDPGVHLLSQAGPQFYDIPAFCAALS